MSKYVLTAGVTHRQAQVGRYFRVLSAVSPLQVRLYSQGREIYSGVLSSGLGISFEDRDIYPAPYDAVEVLSEESQTVDLWHELAKVDDDRLSGNFDINAALNVASTAPRSHGVSRFTVSGGGQEVLPIRDTRKSALIQVDGEVYIQSTDGVILSGSFTWQNQAALTLIPVSGSVDVRINEDYN